LPVVFVPVFVDRGFTKAEAALALIPYGLAAIVARPAWGLLVDRIAVRRAAMSLACFSAVAIGLLIPDVPGAPWMAAVGVLVGFASGGIMVVNLLLWPTYFGRSHLGAINGVVSPVTSLASSAAPYIVSLLYDMSGRYSAGLLVLVVCWLVALLPLYFAQAVRQD
jgi:nitrate/nitrite transporter NarK